MDGKSSTNSSTHKNNRKVNIINVTQNKKKKVFSQCKHLLAKQSKADKITILS
jgi:hypothetical protein